MKVESAKPCDTIQYGYVIPRTRSHLWSTLCMVALFLAASPASAASVGTFSIIFDLFPSEAEGGGGDPAEVEAIGVAEVRAPIPDNLIAAEIPELGAGTPGFFLSPVLILDVFGSDEFDGEYPLLSGDLRIVSVAFPEGSFIYTSGVNLAADDPIGPPFFDSIIFDGTGNPEGGDFAFSGELNIADPSFMFDIGDPFFGPTNGERPIAFTDFALAIVERGNLENNVPLEVGNARFSIIAAVPVPPSLPLLAGTLGLAGLALRRRQMNGSVRPNR